MSSAVELQTDLKEIATDVVSRAMKGGATACEAVIREGDQFSTMLRMGDVETLKESGGRALGLRVFMGKRAASTYTSDISPEGIERLVSGALELARVTSEDPHAGIPEPELLGSAPGDFDLYHEDVYSLPPAERIDYARRAEKAALEVDARLNNSDGASFDADTGHRVLANSHGFVGEYRSSYCGLSAAPIAQDPDTGAMQRDYWFSSARTLKKLESPELIGRTAAQRTLRRLGARKVATTRVPIVFEPMAAQTIIEHIFEAAEGEAIYRNASFFQGKLGQKVAAAHITVIDDGIMPGGFGTSPFDSEGVPSQRTTVISKGVLSSYLLNCYTARKLGLKTTGNAARSLAGNPGIGSGNFYLEAGTKAPQEIIRGIKNGLLVTEFLGFGVNLVTGDYSRGASGIWIENGELTYPVEEITVAGNLREMFMNITEVGDDLEFRGVVASPTFRIDGMTVAGA